MTEHDLATLKANVHQRKANVHKRVELICFDGETVEGEVVTVGDDDVLVDAVRRLDGTVSSAEVLAVKFSEIEAVRIVNE